MKPRKLYAPGWVLAFWINLAFTLACIREYNGAAWVAALHFLGMGVVVALFVAHELADDDEDMPT